MTTSSGGQPVVFHADAGSYARLLWAFLPSLAGLALVALLGGLSLAFSRLPAAGLAAACVLVGGCWLIAVSAWARLFTRTWREYRGIQVPGGTRPVLTVDRAGVTLHLLGTRLGWQEITAVTLASAPPAAAGPSRLPGAPPPRSQTLVFITASAPSAAGPWPAAVDRRAARYAERYGTPYAVDVTRLDAPVSEVIASIRSLGRVAVVQV
ncbi:MAG: hypothetical protein ACM32E_23595 [Gemmatimonadota bacterium]